MRALALMSAFSSHAPSPPPVEYTVRLNSPQTQTVEMSMTLHGVEGPALDVCLPVWRPGRYVVLDPSGTVRWLAARTPAGKPLECRKTDKATWRIETGGSGDVIVDYLVYANSIGDRTRHVDDSHAFLSPSSVFVYAPSFRDRALRVALETPKGWDVACGLEPDGGDPAVRGAKNYDELVDAPIEAGRHEIFSFDVDGTRHDIVTWWGGRGEGPGGAAPGEFFNADRMGKDFAKIVRAESAVFGDRPYPRYVFLLHVYPGGRGGTEHWNSTIMQTSPGTFQSEDAYRRLMGLVSHEYFHTWNVKRLRPAGLRPYDYQRENYTDLLWVAEGTTSYYGGLILVRTGHTTPDAYLDQLASAIGAQRARPGAGVQSAEESSFDAWIHFSAPTPDDVNSRVSFYDRGSLVSALLDLEIRRRTGNAASLDTLMRDLYRRFPETGPGYTRADVIAAAERIVGGAMGEFFDRYTRGAEPLAFEDSLGVVGLTLEHSPKDAKEPDAQIPYVGVNTDVGDPPSVTAVMSDGPAYSAGLIAGDVLVALNEQRVRGGTWDSMVKMVKPGDVMKLRYFRYDALREVTFRAAGKPSEKWKIRRVSDPTESQQKAYESWLGQPWPRAASGSVAKPSSP